MKIIFIIFVISFNTSLNAEWIYIDTATGQGEGQQTWIWDTYTTNSNTDYRKFSVLSVLPSPMKGVINSATSDAEVYCSAPTIVTMSNLKYYSDKKGVNIISKYSDNKTVLEKVIPTHTPAYKAVKIVCKS